MLQSLQQNCTLAVSWEIAASLAARRSHFNSLGQVGINCNSHTEKYVGQVKRKCFNSSNSTQVHIIQMRSCLAILFPLPVCIASEREPVLSLARSCPLLNPSISSRYLRLKKLCPTNWASVLLFMPPSWRACSYHAVNLVLSLSFRSTCPIWHGCISNMLIIAPAKADQHL